MHLKIQKQELSEGVLRLLFPARCPVCDKAVPFLRTGCCDDCKETPIPITGSRCLRCSKPLEDAHTEYCTDCTRMGHVFDRGFAVYAYRDIAPSLYRFKYAGRREYASFYADAIVRRYGRILTALRPDALVPVPVHEKRLQKRGYNQAAVLAHALGKKLSIPVREDLIIRAKATVPQKNLDVMRRKNNLKNAFKLLQNDVKLKTIVIVDDIYTTGATMDAVARLFKSCGVGRLYFVTVAIGSL